MATITMNPKKLKKGEVRISPGKERKRADPNRAADTFGGGLHKTVKHIRSRGVVPGAKHRSD